MRLLATISDTVDGCAVPVYTLGNELGVADYIESCANTNLFVK